MLKNKLIFVACDTSDIKQVKKIIKHTRNDKLKIIPKFGHQLFYSKNGRRFIEKFKGTYFLDLKIMDVSNTAISAIDSIKDLKGCRYITIHVHGGLNMMKSVVKKSKLINKKLAVLGVTILTSLNNKSIREVGHTKTVNELVLSHSGLIKKSGCHGVVASAHEVKIIKKKYKRLFVVTPGIRLPGDKKNDQSRVVTPYDAFYKYNADAIVIGRSLTESNIKNNVKKLINHLSP
tara:strand:+ start:358 stop:1056 length:699 start_codon:yes stop_codon:yes gene_type:complete